MRTILLIVALILVTHLGFAQELNCKTIVIAEQVQGTDPKVFKTMEQAITEFVNTRKWGSDNFENKEKIECVFTIIINNLNVKWFYQYS